MYINTHITKEKIGAAATAPKVLKPNKRTLTIKSKQKQKTQSIKLIQP